MATKLTPEEVSRLKELKTKSDSKIYEFGQLEIEMILTEQYLKSLHETKAKLQSEFESLQEEEQKAAKELNEKYGAGTIDLEKEEFNPA